jgi:nitrogen-specific signal transduction histidine kinase
MVQDVVRKHDGVLRVRSGTRPGHSGSVFAIFLPEA